MKLHVEKLSTRNVKVELTTNTSKPPMKIELTPTQVEAAIALLRAAMNAEKLKVVLDL